MNQTIKLDLVMNKEKCGISSINIEIKPLPSVSQILD